MELFATLPQRYHFIFVCQAGKLEVMAWLLLASLRKQLEVDYEITVAVPSDRGQLNPLTLELLQGLQVNIAYISSPLARIYPIANKIECLKMPLGGTKRIFMDTDMLCLRPFFEHRRFKIPLNLKPVDLANFFADQRIWEKVYRLADVPLPRNWVFSTVDQRKVLPYFNSGFLAVDNVASLRLGQEWSAIAEQVYSTFSNDKNWVDQISLSVAIEKIGIVYDELDERFNFPAHLKPLPEDDLPFFCHYHYPPVIRESVFLKNYVHELIREFPQIRELDAQDGVWNALIHDLG